MTSLCGGFPAYPLAAGTAGLSFCLVSARLLVIGKRRGSGAAHAVRAALAALRMAMPHAAALLPLHAFYLSSTVPLPVVPRCPTFYFFLSLQTSDLSACHKHAGSAAAYCIPLGLRGRFAYGPAVRCCTAGFDLALPAVATAASWR